MNQFQANWMIITFNYFVDVQPRFINCFKYDVMLDASNMFLFSMHNNYPNYSWFVNAFERLPFCLISISRLLLQNLNHHWYPIMIHLNWIFKRISTFIQLECQKNKIKRCTKSNVHHLIITQLITNNLKSVLYQRY